MLDNNKFNTQIFDDNITAALKAIAESAKIATLPTKSVMDEMSYIMSPMVSVTKAISESQPTNRELVSVAKALPKFTL